jgi:hypothetical protein
MTCSQTMQAVTPNPSAADPAKHVKYNLGMVLGVDDFVQEFTYHRARREWQARDAIGYGTLWGLGVRPVDGGARGPRLLVECGAALTPRGQLVSVAAAQCAYLNDWLSSNRAEITRRGLLGSPPGALTVHAVLAYADCDSDPAPLAGEPCRSEDQLTAPSRVRDGFALELHLDPPRQAEDDALRNFMQALAQVPIVSGSGNDSTLADFEKAVRNSRLSLASPPSSPPDASNAACDFFIASAGIPSGQIEDCLRAALRIWTVELRPLCRPDWLANDASGSAAAAQHPSAEDFLLLAEVELPVQVDAMTGAWSVSNWADVQVHERERPFLVSLRTVQEALIKRLGEVAAVSLPPGASYAVAAAGVLSGDGTASGPALGGLKVLSVDKGELVIGFDQYLPPGATRQYVVKSTLLSSTILAPMPESRVIEFRAKGIALGFSNTGNPLAATDIKKLQLMLEVSQIG